MAPQPEPVIVKMFKIGDKVKVKPGTIYGQDFCWNTWSGGLWGKSIIFKVDGYVGDEGKVKLVAKGYGLIEARGAYGSSAYGNGAIYVYQENLIPVDNELLVEGRTRMIR